MVTTLLAFLFALGVLIAVHEWGHYRMALACGVKVLRFSIGFGPTLVSHTSRQTGIEYALCALPLGGYVRMLDEREGEVPADQLTQAFNRQPLVRRALIVAAGPLANLVLAVLLYSVVNWMGLEQAAAVLSTPPPQTLAERAGIRGGERVTAVGWDGEIPEPVQSFEDVRWWLARAALLGRDVTLITAPGESRFTLGTASQVGRDAGPSLYQQVGITAPRSPAVIGELVANDVAQRSGLLPGDRVLQVNGADVPDAASLRAQIRTSVVNGAVPPQAWRVAREAQVLELSVTPRIEQVEGTSIGRIGAAIGGPVERVTVRYGVWEGLSRALDHTVEVSALSLRLLGRIAIGEASLRNISGPVSIADYAGKSASSGLVHYVLFLALISISLGVLNLLPIPMLDGGHLMYYLWEWLIGTPPSERWMDGLQRAGMAVLLAMMGIAMWNDLSRLLL